jgi:predicted nucleotidyltransferase
MKPETVEWVDKADSNKLPPEFCPLRKLKEHDMVSNKNDIIMFLQTHKDEMAQRFGVVSVGLFGSYARGEAREDSDIDIAIEIMSEKKSLGNFLGIRRYLEQQFGKTVDLGIESTLKPLAREMVAKEIIHV